MAVQRFVAHPLVVAVALGLLTPAALEEDLDAHDRKTPRTTETVDVGGVPVAVREIDPDEQARVEREWQVARDLTVR